MRGFDSRPCYFNDTIMSDEKKIDKKKQENEIESLVSDVLLERPITFRTNDGRFYYLYPPSIGVQLLCDPILRSLDFDRGFLEVNSTWEMARVISSHRNEVLRIVAYHSFKRRSDAIIEEYVLKRIDEFDKGIDMSDLLTIFSYISSWNIQVNTIQKFYHIDKERDTKEYVHNELSKKGGLVFGGRSIFGKLIDCACQRYGWQVGYVLWGVSANNINMMMSDSITTIQLTKDEMSKMGVSNDREYIDADNKDNIQKIKELLRGT